MAAARLAARYITNRFFPDKAIDLVDEAASKLRMQQESKPEAIEVGCLVGCGCVYFNRAARSQGGGSHVIRGVHVTCDR